MTITIRQGESPTATQVLNALINTLFYEDDTPWEPTPEQIKVLVELFGPIRPATEEELRDLLQSDELGDNVVPINREGR